MPLTLSLNCIVAQYERGASEPQASSALAVAAADGQIARVEQSVEKRTITVFADYVCPFSYLTGRALAEVARDLQIDVVRRAFELSPPELRAAPVLSDEGWEMVQQVAAEHGVELQRPRFVPRTRKAHEAVKFASMQGLAAALDHALYQAYFEQGADIGRIDVLVEVGVQVGLDPTALKIALDLDVHTEDVLADRTLAEELEITGTPALVAGADVHMGLLSQEQLRDWLEE